jgi:hypothetical protein
MAIASPRRIRQTTHRGDWRCLDSLWDGFEGLNHAGVTDANLLVILNDNAIGIDPSWCLEKILTAVKNGKIRGKIT